MKIPMHQRRWPTSLNQFIIWILLVACKRYLIDGIGLVSWLFWQVFHAIWQILFLCGGGHARCMRGEMLVEGVTFHTEVTLCGGGDTLTLKVTSHVHKVGKLKLSHMNMRWLCGRWDVTSLISKAQMMNILRNCPLYRPQSHLTCMQGGEAKAVSHFTCGDFLWWTLRPSMLFCMHARWGS